MHVLLIEPDILLAKSYVRALQRAGHSVALARSAQSAVHLADKKQPDAVVLELQLPGHNGVEFLYEFRSYHEWLSIPIVIHTFVPMHELAHTALLPAGLGVHQSLYKPTTSLANLCAAVERAAATATTP